MIEFIKNILLRTILRILLLIPLIWILYVTIVQANAWAFIFSHVYPIILILLGIFLWLDLIFNFIKNKLWYLIIFLISLIFLIYSVVGVVSIFSGGIKELEGIALAFGIIIFSFSLVFVLFYFFRFKRANKKTKKKI